MLDDRRERTNALIGYHSPISRALTAERTSLESRLIPVSAYIVTACLEAYWRYPDMIRTIESAMPAEEIGRRARRPGCRVNTVYHWSIANFPLVGRKVLGSVGLLDDQIEPMHTVLDFWERSTRSYRSDGTRQAWDNGAATPYDEAVIAELVAGVRPVDDLGRVAIKRFNATLVSYLFLLYFDTRVGSGDTGPYRLGDGRTLLVRDYYHLAESDFPWSNVAAGVPHANLTAALVLDDVDVRITDFGTSYTTPEDYLDRLVGFALYEPDPVSGELRSVSIDTLDVIVAAVRAAQSKHYRNIAAMSRDAKIRAGAYVYFSFLRPFAEEAGVADELDWTVPRDTPAPIYELMSAMDGDNTPPPPDVEYYEPMA